MPLYRCTSPASSLDVDQRQELARAITDIHCELTGAPPTFVHVQFFEAPRRAGGPTLFLHGGIRAGRDGELVDALVERCCAAAARIASVPVDQVAMRTSQTHASWVFEGGRVFPEPGDEASWTASATHP